jgi:RND family efflux transporter MFP subunit
LNQQIADTEEALRVKQNELLEKQGALAKDGAGYQQSAIEKSDDEEEYKKYQQLVQKNAYEQQASPEVIAMQEEINRLTVQLTNFKEYKALMESQKAATDTSRLTAGQKEALEAQKAMAELTSKETIAKLEASKSGIVAQFDGIVTDIAVVEGCDIVRGMSLVTLASSEEIIVKCTVNKYDIQSIEEGQVTSSKIGNTDYTGKVTRIERITGSDAGSTPGVGVEITLDTPDEAIILGLDSKTKVSIAAVEGTMCIPKSAAVEEDGKTYVFVEKDKKAVRKEIETGVKNDDMIEVCSGLKEGEIVVWNEEVEMKDGMDIRVSR